MPLIYHSTLILPFRVRAVVNSISTKPSAKMLTFYMALSTSRNGNFFLLLISVSGIGGNTARMILSALSPAELVNVISTENANMLKTVKGIGLKTAQRVIVDLKDKIKTGAMAATAVGGAAGALLPAMNAEVQEEAVAALTMLGFAAAPSQKVVLAILKEEPDAPVEKVIKLALKRL